MEDESLDLRRYLEIAARWWWLLLLGPLVGGLVAFVTIIRDAPLYETQATILVQSQSTGGVAPSLSDFQTSQRLAVTYRELITVLSMLEEVAAALEIPYSAKQLTGMVEASLIPNTQLLWVKARNSNPEHAALIANTLAERFIDRRQEDFLAELERLTVAAEARGLLNSQEILDAQLIALQSLNNILESLASSPSTSEELVETQVSTLQGLVSALNTLGDLASAQDLFGAQLSTLGNLSIVEFAPVPDSARSSALTTAIFALILIGLVPIPAVFLMEYFSDRIRTSEQVEKTFHLTSLGTVSRWQESSWLKTD